MKDTIKVIVNLPKEQVKFLELEAKKRSVSVTDMISSAINTESFFSGEIGKGSKFLVEFKNGNIKEVIRVQKEPEPCDETNLFHFGEGLCGGYERAFCNLEKGHKGKHKMVMGKGSGYEQVKYEWEK